jgi:hypothetical protein
VGVLSFEEANLEEQQKQEIMQSFEETLLAGLDRDQYDITWIEHTDKGRLELNFVIPNVELSTGKRLQPILIKQTAHWWKIGSKLPILIMDYQTLMHLIKPKP